MKFHENLKRICNAQGTTPTAVLKEMGVTTSKLAAWNRGALPKQDMMVRLAEHLGCTVMDFFWDESDELRLAQTQRVKADPENEDEADILRIYRALSRQDKHSFMAMIYDFEKRMELSGENKETKSTVG